MNPYRRRILAQKYVDRAFEGALSRFGYYGTKARILSASTIYELSPARRFLCGYFRAINRNFRTEAYPRGSVAFFSFPHIAGILNRKCHSSAYQHWENARDTWGDAYFDELILSDWPEFAAANEGSVFVSGHGWRAAA